MKRSSLLNLCSLLFLGLSLTGCLQDECDATRTYIRWDPVYLSATTLRAEVEISEPRQLENTGKIYYYGDYLLINEYQEGIHFFDNSDPANPQPLSFLPIPGNVDMSIRNDHLYADSYIDLLTFDIADPTNPRLVNRIEEVFDVFGFTEGKGYIVEYQETNITETVSCEDFQGPVFWRNDVLFATAEASFDGATRSNSTPGSGNVGTGGSLARFTIAKNHLYTVSEYDLKVFDLSIETKPDFLTTISLGWGIETIFPYRDALFIGAQNGMHTVDISTPGRPEYQGSFWHTTACDPVYVDGDIAYVTLRDGTECEGFANQLDVVNIKDLQNPYLLRTFEMHHPIGLSVYKDHLYLCEDDQGLKVFDASEPLEVGNRLLTQIKGITAVDIITLWEEQIALVIGPDGLRQYDISEPDNPVFLSFIAVEND
ncbi:MAG TPA: hypothetical protein VJ953_11895 [Saprospiraceae bacterium]|nr:hypothetical protein [Saprospiraceae bacterium]